MRCLALNILDITQNSIKAKAKEIVITIKIDNKFLSFSVKDDGEGMTKENILQAKNPFFTSKDKKVGLGLALLDEETRDCGGMLEIESITPKGLKITASYKRKHINFIPLGDIADVAINLAVTNENIHFIFNYIYCKECIKFDSYDMLKYFIENKYDYNIILKEKKFLKDKINVLNGGIDI